MKTIKFLTMLILFSTVVYTQNYNPFGFKCLVPGTPPESAPFLEGGLYKPESIADYTTEPSAYFPVLVVYVQFTNDPGGNVSWWPSARNQPPTFMGNVIATAKSSNFGSNWWDAYDQSTETLSDYWMEVSRGKLHLVGKEVHVVLPHDVSYYNQYSEGKAMAMEDLFSALASNQNIDWPTFDLWEKENGNFVYGDGDGFVDMMYIVARSNPCSPFSTDGYFRPYGVRDNCTHGSEHTVYNSGGTVIKVKGAFDETGSGFQISPGGCENGVIYDPMDKWGVISFSGHEHGHYFFGYGNYFEYHQPYSKVNNYWGLEEYLSPYELMLLDYQQPEAIDFNEPEISIDDWTSRGSASQMLKVPIGSSTRNEFFIIANRQKESYYDKIMWGDTCHDNPYFDLGEQSHYGKGIYIYHAYPGELTSSGYPFGIHIDQECADGLWNWEHTRNAAPDWDPTNYWLPVFEKTAPVFNVNDASPLSYSLTARDGKNVSKTIGTFNHTKWFGIGKKELQQYGTGTDRIYTNSVEDWTSREFKGDRWDAWRLDHNVVFSPYSSPSTVDWDNEYSGIFIYLESMSGGTANLKIYKDGEGGMRLDDILAATPPSKPMLYKPVEVVDCNGTFGHPKITWDNNLEPDMERTGLLGRFKRYYIYRAFSANSNAPLVYTYIATHDDYTPNDPAVFIDNNPLNGTIIYCSDEGNGGNDTYFRYHIVAVDANEDESVPSDFVSIKGHSIIPDRPGHLTEEPSVFELSQNYPNPFNPSTQINFALPQNSFVTVKVYNAIGEEVARLVNNEFKSAGSYSVTFDGSNLGSGIYFYSIEASQYKETKKMVLIK